MIRITRHQFSLLFIATALTGCATMTPEANKVMVHSQMSNFINDCEKLGPLSANGFDYTFVEANLRELAVSQYGADTIVVINTDDHITYMSGQAIAFKCFK